MPTQVGGFRPITAQPNRTVDSEVGLAYDISSGANQGRLHMVYPDAPSVGSNDLNIFTRFSDDDGNTSDLRKVGVKSKDQVRVQIPEF